ncbi:MAG TPA: methyl-accepting chemotaxis protein, partial [Rhodocyclaceae bacterium]|nr:methyl-accepting chemotaxis protein [Rhodocyclaceae bacterium]
MSALFSPAVGLMDRLRYPRKFLVLALPLLVLVGALFYSLISALNATISTAEHELDGLKMVRAVNQMVQLVQQHRGLSAGVLGGNEGMRAVLAEKEKAAAAAVQAVEVLLPAGLRDGDTWKGIRSDWDRLGGDGLKLAAPENFKAHTALVGRSLEFLIEIADASELTLDPQIDTYYLMDSLVQRMPAALEKLAVLRGRGTGILARKELTQSMRTDMGTTLAELGSATASLNTNLNKAMHYAPVLKATLEAPSREFSASVDQFKALVAQDVLGERFATAPQAYFDQGTAVIDRGYRMMFDLLVPQFEQQLRVRAAEAKQTLVIDIVVTLLVVFLIVYFAVGMYLSVIHSVHVYAAGANRLAAGDFTARFESAGKDELHEAAGHFNHMADSLRQLISRVQGNVQQLRQVADGLAATSQQISRGASHQSESASSMAAAVEETTVGVDHIANSAQNAKEYSQQSDMMADRGGQIVGQVVTEIQLIADTVNESALAVEDLGRQSDQISAIVGTIKDIADQTNLLALNAVIEAARAGESGRGFAVVADEVRKLAERTTKSTQEIAQMIASIQAGTATAVTSMKTGVTRVAAGVEQAKEAGQVIGQVQEQSRQVAEAIEDISIALREQATASTDIAKNVERIAQMAEENNSAANGNAQAASELKRLS